MDLEVKWSPEAIEDLESIAEFINIGVRAHLFLILARNVL